MSDPIVPASETPDPSQPPAEPTAPKEPTAFEIPDTALISVKIGGEEKLVPWPEARQGFQLHGDYTRKTQALASERERFKAEQAELQAQKEALDNRLAQLQAVFNDPQKVQALALALYQRQNQPQAPRPLTQEDIAGLESTLEQRLHARMEKAEQDWATRQAQQRDAEDLTNFTTGLIATHPRLKALEGIDDAIYAKLQKLHPETLEEAKEQARRIVDGYAQALKAEDEAEAKRAALDKDKALRGGIEPRGGAPVMPAPMSLKTRAEREAAVLAAIEAAQ